MYEKYPGKIDGLLRHNFYTTFPPTVSGIPPVLPPAVNFGSLQGAFQPKSANPDLPSRLGSVPSSLSQKGTPVSEKPGKWCAMHVRVAYMILRHQEKMKVSDPHKLDFRSDLLTCGLPGAAAFGSLPHSQDLARPATLFTPAGEWHQGSSPLEPRTSLSASPCPASRDLSPSFHPLDSSSSVFGQKESPGAASYTSPHDPWNQLHRTPPSFPTAPAWPKGGAGDVAERGGHHDKDPDKQEAPVIKDEKDRDTMFSRLPLRGASPATPTSKHPSLAHEEPRPHGPDHHRYSSPKEVKVKEEPELAGFEGALRPGGPFHSPLHPLGALAVFDRPQAGTGGGVSPYLVAAPPSYAPLEAWREPYHRALDLHSLQRLPRFLDPAGASPGSEDFERARMYGLAPPPHPSLLAYPRHQNGLLGKATPAAAAVGLLSAPPPLIPTSGTRPGSPRRPPDIRELAAVYKERESR
uniref:Fibrosin n=1 Tax=Sphenodon punctatus TaxID=8508 RepID=A0A8D0H3Z3_SPHPU